MQTPGTISDSRTSHNGGQPLPLFRQEALLYQQHKYYGDIILIRPLSLTLLTWLVIAIVALAVGLLGFGHYTEKARLPVSVPASTAAGNQAEIQVPGSWRGFVRPGTHLSVRCWGCSSSITETATVLTISNSPLTTSGTNLFKVTLSLPPQAVQTLGLNQPPQAGTKVEAEIPLGRKPLIQWFFSRPAS
jgi:hypothetical protein